MMHASKSAHELSTDAVAELLGTNLSSGLSLEEIGLRRERFGLNQISAAPHVPAWRKLLEQFAQPLSYVLLIAAGVTLYLGEYVDSGVIAGVVLINAIVGFIQERKAERAIDALSRMLPVEATVRRACQTLRVPAVEVVPGDVVVLQSGDRVPADIRLTHVRAVQSEESSLTGESLPVHKHSGPMALDTMLPDRKNMVFAGTLITSGQGEGIVWSTGNNTETGRIAGMLQGTISLATPLTRKIAEFSRLVLWVILGLAALTFAIGIARGGTFAEMFMASVALAVGAIPEGLPAAVTITLAIGVTRMARRNAIIRKLPAVEALGSTTVICSDKTGTLTQNAMTVQQIFAGGELFTVSGSGFEDAGELLSNGQPVTVKVETAIYETLLAGVLNNDAQIHRSKSARISISGDPTEAALTIAAQKAGLVPASSHFAFPRLDLIPFESKHQFMATLHPSSKGKARVIYKKGSLERILDRCSEELDNRGNVRALSREEILRVADEMAASGLRVLAFARKIAHVEGDRLEHAHVQSDLCFVGLQGMMDPPRAEAIKAVQSCQRAGIKVKMITGDHPLTASAIARQLGLQESTGSMLAVTGRQLASISERELPEIAAKTSVFARVLPEQKLQLVRALQARGQIVAMTGDGVNDAPALKQADIGIAMGITGTDVAKGAADMILADDNFASIEAAVEEGRAVFDNLTKFIVWTLPTNAGEALVLIAGIVLGTTLPALPVQLLWVNLTTAIFLGLALVFEPKERDLMERRPRDPKQPLLTFPLIMRTGLVSLLIVAGAFGAFLWEQEYRGKTIVEARTTVVNVIVFVEIFYLLSCRSLLHSVFSKGFWSNSWIFRGIAAMLVAQVLFTHTNAMNKAFHTAPLDASSWLYVCAVGVGTFVIVEVEKLIRLRSGKGTH
jgi:cation-transporting P-type ATPase F